MRKSQQIERDLKDEGLVAETALYTFGIASASGVSLGFKDAGLASYMSDGGVGYALTLSDNELMIFAVDRFLDEKSPANIAKSMERMQELNRKITKDMIESITYKGTFLNHNLIIKLKDEKKKIIAAIEKPYRDAARQIVAAML